MQVFRGTIKYVCLWLFVFGPMFKIAAGDGVSLSQCGGSRRCLGYSVHPMVTMEK